MRVDVAHRGAVGGDHDVGVGDLGRRSRRRAARFAPWCTTTRRPGVKRAASAAQLPTTAGGAITSAGPVAGARERGGRASSGVLPRPMSSARQPPSPAGVEEAEPRQRLGLVAAQLADEARRARVTGSADDVGRGGEQVGGPAAALDA